MDPEPPISMSSAEAEKLKRRPKQYFLIGIISIFLSLTNPVFLIIALIMMETFETVWCLGIIGGALAFPTALIGIIGSCVTISRFNTIAGDDDLKRKAHQALKVSLIGLVLCILGFVFAIVVMVIAGLVTD